MNPELEPKIPVEEIENSQVMEDRLFTFRDIDGNEQFETVEKIGRLGDYLREMDSRIIGVSIAGSTVKGYSKPESEKKSDVDLYIIYNDNDKNLSSHEQSDVMKNAHTDYLPKFSKNNNIKIDHLNWGGLNIADLSPHIIFSVPQIVKPLIFPIFGDTDEVKSCIDVVKSAVSNWTPEQKKGWVSVLAAFAVGGTYESDKFFARNGIESTPQLVEEYRKKKKEMYKERIQKLFIN